MRANTAELLAHALARAGVEVVAGVPGASVFTFGDAVDRHPRLKPFLVRHEITAAFAADAYFRVSGKLMAVMLHALPGAANALAGIANAYCDSSTMIVVLGETGRQALGRGAYQELSRSMDADVPQLLRHVSKRVWVATHAAQIVEQAMRAVRLARAGRPGPTVLAVPQDVWTEEVEIDELPSLAGYAASAPAPLATDLDEAVRLLKQAERPLILAGNGVNLSRSRKDLHEFVRRLQIPLVTTVSGKGVFPEDDRLSLGITGWFGTASANRAGRMADLVLCLGARLGEGTTSSWQPEVSIGRDTRFIQVDIDPEQIANVYPVSVGIVSDVGAVIRELNRRFDSPLAIDAWRESAIASHREWIENCNRQLESTPSSPLGVGPIVRSLRRATRGSPVNIVCDVGKHHFWIAQQFQASADDIVLSTMGGGVMSFGAGGAIGAALARPAARTFAWVGDGCLSMNPHVLATAAEYRLPITYLAINDYSYSTIAAYQRRVHQRTYFSEFNGSGSNPDYRLSLAELGKAFGVSSRQVTSVDEIDPALDWALHQEGPTLVDFVVDPESMVPPGGGSKLLEYRGKMGFPWRDEPQRR